MKKKARAHSNNSQASLLTNKKFVNRDTLITGALILFFLSNAFSFDFPQNVTSESDFSVFFAQSLIETFSNSIVFTQSAPVYASEQGVLLITTAEQKSPFDFVSALGNTLILAHDSHIYTVYGNLKEVYISPKTDYIDAKTQIGFSGGGAWQKNKSGVMFFTCDTKNANSFNPFMLLPRPENKSTPSIRAIVLVNRKGTAYDLSVSRSIPADTYLIYREVLAQDSVPYKILVTVNGTQTDSVNYTMLKQNESVLETAGKRPFSFKQAYPSNQKQLLAQASFNKGNAVLQISIAGLSEETRTLTYYLDIF